MNNSFAFVINNIPEPKKEGRFYPYSYVFENAYGYKEKQAGKIVREDLEHNTVKLFKDYGVGIQLGARSHCKRGIRIINLR